MMLLGRGSSIWSAALQDGDKVLTTDAAVALKEISSPTDYDPYDRDTTQAAKAESGRSRLRQEMTTHLSDLRAFARFLTRDPIQADDLVQDTLARALGALDRFEAGTNMKAWLLTIARNGFFEDLRRRGSERLLLRQRGILSSDHMQGQPSRDDLSDLQRLLFKLSPLLREALVLVGAHGLSHDEVSIICGVPAGTIRARVSRARTLLAKHARDALQMTRSDNDVMTVD